MTFPDITPTKVSIAAAIIAAGSAIAGELKPNPMNEVLKRLDRIDAQVQDLRTEVAELRGEVRATRPGPGR